MKEVKLLCSISEHKSRKPDEEETPGTLDRQNIVTARQSTLFIFHASPAIAMPATAVHHPGRDILKITIMESWKPLMRYHVSVMFFYVLY